MKKQLLLALLISAVGASAQSYNPASAYSMPEIGMELFKTENPYITVYSAAPNDTSAWTAYQRWMRYKAPNVPYTGMDKQALYSNNAWMDVQQTTNDFILNGNGQIVVYFNDVAYTYPGYDYRSKSRDSIFYNAQGAIEKMVTYTTNPPDSDTYVKSSTYFLQYDSNGKRLRDSLLVDNGPAYTIHYTYDGQGNLIQQTMMEGPDTSYKTIYVFNNTQQMVQTFNWGFDQSSDAWTLYNADTFEYTNGYVSKHIGYGLLFNNGNLSFGPFVNESYTYTNTGKLLSIERSMNQEDQWIPESKTIFSYGANDKPYIGYTYPYDGMGWSAMPTEKYLFDDFITGLPTAEDISEVRIFPNPAHESLNIQTNNQPATLALTDLNGRTILRGTCSSDTQLSTASIPNGMYFLTIETSKGSSTQRVVIQH